MILSAFIYLGVFIISTITLILPVSQGFPSEVQDAFTLFGGYVQLLDTLLPIQTLATVLAILISTDLAIFGFKTFKWLVSHLPFVGGNG